MTDQPDAATAAELDPYYDQLYRYEIAAALNAVIRACRDITRHHSSHGYWTPITTKEDPTHQHLIHAARQDILAVLHNVITCAENVLTAIETDRTKAMNRRPPCRVSVDG